MFIDRVEKAIEGGFNSLVTESSKKFSFKQVIIVTDLHYSSLMSLVFRLDLQKFSKSSSEN